MSIDGPKPDCYRLLHQLATCRKYKTVYPWTESCDSECDTCTHASVLIKNGWAVIQIVPGTEGCMTELAITDAGEQEYFAHRL